MLKARGFTLLLVSLALALGAAWIARGWVMSRLTPQSSQPQVPVVVAAAEIPFGVRVDRRFLRVIELPAAVPVAPHFSDPKQAVGLIALQKVLPGEILLRGQFARHPAGSMLAALLKPGMRAITVPVNEVVGVAGFLLPGNHVDVVEARMDGQRAVTKTVLQDLLVLAVDQTDSHTKNGPVVVHAVTLEVTPPQADILVKAMTEGRIQLTLRGPTDTALSTPPPPRPRKIVVIRRPVRVTARRPPVRSITIIRGTQVDRAHASS